MNSIRLIKTLKASLFAVCASVGLHAQVSDVTIGSTTPSVWMDEAPTNLFYAYSWSSTLYMKTDLGASGVITKLGIFNDKALAAAGQKIYIRHTSSFFQTGTDYPNPSANSEFQLVFDGTINYVDRLANPSAITEVTLNQPFIYNGQDNIEVVFESHSGQVFSSAMYYFDNPGIDYRTKSDHSNTSFPSTFQNGAIHNNFPTLQFTLDRDINCNRVGIGTFNPRGMLDVRSCEQGYPGLYLTGYNYQEGDITWSDQDALQMGIWDHDNKTFLERFSIRKNGRVAINNTTPDATLHINKVVANLPVLMLDNTGGNTTELSWAQGKTMQMGTWGGSSPSFTSQFEISPAGNIGIAATPTADYRLSVNGAIRATKVVVETGWADFVFEKDYQLPTLHEIEEYVNKNHHLPGIPSAKEVEENGVTLGEIEAKLLQKIEELTLYTIQQQKEIDALKKELKKN